MLHGIGPFLGWIYVHFHGSLAGDGSAGSTAAKMREIQITAFGSFERVEGFTVELSEEIFVTAAEYARLRGVDQSYVYILRRTGRLVTDEQQRIAVRASDELVARTRLRRPRDGSAGAGPGHPWCSKLEVMQRLPKDQAQRIEAAVAGVLLDAANSLAPRVASIHDPAECRALLAQELGRATRRVLRAIQDSQGITPKPGRSRGAADR